jgi:dienelactone hydrolase
LYVPPRRTRIATVAAALLVLGGTLLASSSGRADPVDAQSTGQSAVERISASATPHRDGLTRFEFSRGKDRPLPTWVWYPAVGRPHRGTTPRAAEGAAPALGRYPLIVWSHGLHGNPQQHESLLRYLAMNGFVVVAPAYPFTKLGTADFKGRAEVPNQALDASHVITKVLENGNPLANHIDPARMAAAGYSGGGSTTNGLFTKHRDDRLKAGIVISGRPLGAYTGTPVPMLFIHGDKDPVVAYDQGRTAYNAVPWPKAFLTMVGCQHGAALGEPDKGHVQVTATMLDFLRWSLDGSLEAKNRLIPDGTLPGVARFESVGIYDRPPAPASAGPSAA